MSGAIVRREYLRLRALGWPASHAMRCARITAEWSALEDLGVVRMLVEPEQELTIEDLAGEGATESELRELAARADRDGVWWIATQWRDPSSGEWVQADSCGGFVGDDWRDSWIDTDCQRAAIDAYREAATRHETQTACMRAWHG